MPSITLTGKTSGYLLDQTSKYAPLQMWVKPKARALIEDIVRVKERLNSVEQYLGIAKTTWTSTMGAPSIHAHYIVRIGGDASNLGTLREAVDRLRDSGNVDPWEWHFNPTFAETQTDAYTHRSVVSNIAILELYLAIGRIVGGNNIGNISTGGAWMEHYPYGIAPSDSDEVYRVNASPLDAFGLPALTPGEAELFEAFSATVGWEIHGLYSRGHHVEKQPGGYGDWVFNSVDWGSIYPPDLKRKHLPGTRWDGAEIKRESPAAAYGGCRITIFRQDDADDAATGAALEPIETAYSDLWEYVDRSGQSAGGGDPTALAEPEIISERQVRGGAVTTQGAARFRILQYPNTGRQVRYIFEGDFEKTTLVDGFPDTPDAVDEFGPLNLPEQWVASAGVYDFGGQDIMRGYGYCPLNSPVWAHNVAGRVPGGIYEYPEPPPQAYHFQALDPDESTASGWSFGTCSWRSSDDSPFTGMGYPWDSDDPGEEKTPEEQAEALLGNLSGSGGNITSPTFDPATTTPRKYFWMFPPRLDTPDVGNTHRPTGKYDGLTTSLTSRFDQEVARIQGNLRLQTSLTGDEYYVEEEGCVSAQGLGFIDERQGAVITLATQDYTGARWLCWQSPGTNGHSPLEEAVARY